MRTFALIFTALFFSACGQNQEKASQQQADFNQHCLEFAEAEPTLFNMEISKSCDCMWTQMSETMTTAQREYLISFQTAMIKDYDKAIKMSKDGIWDEFKPLYQNMGDACNLG